MAESVQIKGLHELGLRMQALSVDMAGKVARQATAAGASVVRAAARNAAPVRTGNLQKAIVIKRIKSQYSSQYIVAVRRGTKRDVQRAKSGTGQLGRDAYYMHFVEFGTVKMAPAPFMRPALANNVQRATQAMADRLRKRLDKVGV